MKYLFRVFKEIRYLDDIGNYETFGILIIRVCSSGRYVVRQISDISTEYHFVRALAKLCTNGKLAPMHVMDVLEDHLGVD